MIPYDAGQVTATSLATLSKTQAIKLLWYGLSVSQGTQSMQTSMDKSKWMCSVTHTCAV